MSLLGGERTDLQRVKRGPSGRGRFRVGWRVGQEGTYWEKRIDG